MFIALYVFLQARMLLATGWAGLASSMRELERTETVGKLKEGTATIIDRSMDGLSKVSPTVHKKERHGTPVWGCTHVTHGRSRMTMNPRIAAIAMTEHVGFSPTRQTNACTEREAPRGAPRDAWRASCILLRIACEADFCTLCVLLAYR